MQSSAKSTRKPDAPASATCHEPRDRRRERPTPRVGTKGDPGGESTSLLRGRSATSRHARKEQGVRESCSRSLREGITVTKNAMPQLNYYDIFVPGGFPRHTYNPRVSLKLEGRLSEVRQNLCKLVTVTGHTKSGKTVLARKVLPTEDCVWVDGGVVGEERDLWDLVIEQLNLFQSYQVQKQTEIAGTVSGKAATEGSIFVAKTSGEIGGSIAGKTADSETSGQQLTSRVAALKGLRESGTPLVIDDFHYLSKELQGSIVRALKPLVFNGIPVVVIAIPHRRYDALKVEREMTGRLAQIEIPPWEDHELAFISKTGFNLLNRFVDGSIENKLVRESIGSPHLMQDFCRTICKHKQLAVASEQEALSLTETELEAVFKDVAETIGRPIFEKLARGPRQRTDRIQRKLKDGTTVDIYVLILHALAHIRPGLVTLEYEDLRFAIRDISEGDLPQLHEVARVLKHMATIAATDESSTPVIDFEEEDKKLHITDPFFAFYLRWGNLDG